MPTAPSILPTSITQGAAPGFDYRLEGELVPVLHMALDGTVPVYVEHHVLLWKYANMQVGLHPLKKGLKRRPSIRCRRGSSARWGSADMSCWPRSPWWGRRPAARRRPHASAGRPPPDTADPELLRQVLLALALGEESLTGAEAAELADRALELARGNAALDPPAALEAAKGEPG